MKNTLNLVLIPLVVCSFLFGSTERANAQITRSGNGYLFRMKFVKGTTIHYTISTSFNMPSGKAGAKPTTQTMDMPLTIKVTDVKGDLATLALRIDKMPGSNKPLESTAKMDTRGNSKGSVNPAMGSIGNFPMPAKPVKVGESWTVTNDTPTPTGNVKATTTYKFTGLKSVGGTQVASVGLTVKGSSESIKITGSGNMLLLVSDGSLYKMDSAQTVSMQGTTMPIKVRVTRK